MNSRRRAGGPVEIRAAARARISEADIVGMILLGKRGISSRYVARVYSRLRDLEITPQDVEWAASRKVAEVNRNRKS